ncbi:transmembrane protein 198-like, partial [Aquila chrysaetos chrysaetos]|uniref:transmembrane protein 198-like n=1 Tax=Aquila chrysaetos chrysaetos TaxID=223781 RepID=UPI001176B4E8
FGRPGGGGGNRASCADPVTCPRAQSASVPAEGPAGGPGVTHGGPGPAWVPSRPRSSDPAPPPPPPRPRPRPRSRSRPAPPPAPLPAESRLRGRAGPLRDPRDRQRAAPAAPPPGRWSPAPPPTPRCALEPRPPYEPVPAALCALGALFGVVCGCFGYRCFKAIMFLSGLLFGSIVIFLLCYKERVLETQLSLEASAGIALGIGLLCGLVTMLLRSVGLFTTGLLLGLLLATAALVAAAPVLPPPSPWVPAGSLLGLALLCALLALQWPKALTVLSTAVFGAAVVVVCADYFVEALALVLYVYDRLRLAPAGPLCWHSWVLLGAWPALSLLAVLLQWKLTADGVSHTDVILSRRQKRLQLLRIRQKEAKRRQSLAPPEGTYRRKPPPVKRYAGDVLAPSYIRSLRDRQLESGTAPGPTAAPDADCGSAAPPPRRRP